MNIGFTYNVRHFKPDPNDPHYIKEAEFDEMSTINGIEETLKKLGHKVFGIEADESAYEKLKSLKGNLDLVFNIAEGLHGSDREAQIPAILEMLQIPYTGPSPLGYALGLNKVKAKEILTANGIKTPKWISVSNIKDLNEKDVDFFPVIVKPAKEGSSKGILAKNLVNNFNELKNIVEEILDKYAQEVLIEEFLDGREFTVALIGTPPKILPIIEVTFDNLPAGMPKFDHLEAKWIYDDPSKKADPLVCPANIDKELEEQINSICLKTFKALLMADWVRIDLRLNKNGVPNILEVNCPPGIIPDPKENSRFPRAAREGGLNYEQMIEEILNSACKRYLTPYNK